MSFPAAVASRKAGVDAGDLDLSDVTIRVMPPWMSRGLGPGISAITFGNCIFVSTDAYESVVSGRNSTLLIHELVHVNQWRREGWLAFLARYMSDYLRNRLIGLDHMTAYRAIGFEAAAYDVSQRQHKDVA
ncbi:MAG: hypothetical protein BMS9Abin12_1656 [Acidimicrobiia bacterium]|nr:MAG: hypothetical protein BMS9Abin12_1656 [Acidimicrobiia bacterium]